MTNEDTVRQSVLRFAPSPNGFLHLGHAFSALTNQSLAREMGGRLLVRIEDVDRERCRPQFERAIFDDLAWLGLEWEEPVRRQSKHSQDHLAVLDLLIGEGLVYPAFLSRKQAREQIAQRLSKGEIWPHDPDGVPHYPGEERAWTCQEQERAIADGRPFTWRLDTQKALSVVKSPIQWSETGHGPAGETGLVAASPAHWGDVALARSDGTIGYHLAVTVDDALQGITHVVRGVDLFHATCVHRLLQELLGYPIPIYHHHRLVLGEDGRKLSKNRGDVAITALRAAGMQLEDIKRLIAFDRQAPARS